MALMECLIQAKECGPQGQIFPQLGGQNKPPPNHMLMQKFTEVHCMDVDVQGVLGVL